MSSEVLISNIIPFAGSGLVGYALGFALRKVLKWLLIIIGFLAGMFFLGVQLLQKYGYVRDKLGNDISVQLQSWPGLLVCRKRVEHVDLLLQSVMNCCKHLRK